MTYIEYFEDRVNNWLSTATFASYYNLTHNQAYRAINKGRLLRETNFGCIIDLVHIPTHNHIHNTRR